jgi:hypothetical protein
MEEKNQQLYEQTLEKLKLNKSRRLSGEIIAIPWSLPRLSKALPGIEPEKIVVVTAGPKVGKSQLANFLYLFQPIDYLYEHPHCNLDLKIFYFSLEVSKEAIMRQAMAYRLYTKYQIIVSQQKLLSVFNDYVLDDYVEELIEKERPWFEFFESKLDVNDEIRHPTAMFKYIKEWYDTNGTWSYKNLKFGDKIERVRDRYTPNNPNLIVEAIFDHLGLLSTEKDLDQWQTIGRFSSEYCLELRDKYKALIVEVQQQALAGSQQQYTNSGKSIIEKLKPEVGNLGNNKEVSRDVNLMLGLFAPSKYGFSSYKEYDLDRLRDNHRELIIMLNRDGVSQRNIDLYFEGACSYFKELPRPEDMEERHYVAIEQLRNKII